jgi:hypothetical protein
MTFLPRLAIACLAAGAIAGPALAETKPEDLAGKWQLPELLKVPAPGGGDGYLRRSVIFENGTQSLIVEGFGDPEGTVPLFTYESQGPYTIIGPSAVVPGALEVNFVNDSSLFTLHIEDRGLQEGLNLGACPFTPGTAFEIKDCVSGPPFTVAGCVDLDLVQIDSVGVLRFGAEGTDRCVARPTAVDAVVAYERAPM